MKTCSSCGQLIKDDSLFCPFCGAKADMGSGGEEILQVNESDEKTIVVEEAVQNAQAGSYAAQSAQAGYAAQNAQNAQANPYMAQGVQNMQNARQMPPYYAQAAMNVQAYKAANDRPMSVGGWMLTLLIMAIPIVNIIMLFAWGFGDGNTSRKNFCRAQLVYMLIAFVLTVLWIVLFIFVFGAMPPIFDI